MKEKIIELMIALFGFLGARELDEKERIIIMIITILVILAIIGSE